MDTKGQKTKSNQSHAIQRREGPGKNVFELALQDIHGRRKRVCVIFLGAAVNI